MVLDHATCDPSLNLKIRYLSSVSNLSFNIFIALKLWPSGLLLSICKSYQTILSVVSFGYLLFIDSVLFLSILPFASTTQVWVLRCLDTLIFLNLSFSVTKLVSNWMYVTENVHLKQKMPLSFKQKSF